MKPCIVDVLIVKIIPQQRDEFLVFDEYSCCFSDPPISTPRLCLKGRDVELGYLKSIHNN